MYPVELVPEQTAFFLCDMQTRFKTAIYGFDELVLTINKMLKVAKVLRFLGVPVMLLETQRQKSMLRHFGDLHIATIEKSLFTMMTPEVKALLRERPHVKSVVLFGIESHVCVLQSALDLLKEGYAVHVLADGVSSCNREEVPIALAHIRQAGGYITTSESAAFQLQRESGTPRFKQFAAVIKEEKENTVRTSQHLLQHRSSL
ncbi:Isochorismatase-like protein [Melanogaster broomeanus]|nr:Isochorismatase-like protein [Melanogaster broomeanus]